MPYSIFRYIKKKIIWFMLGVVSIIAMECQINNSVGKEIIEVQPLQILYSDTLTLEFSTVIFDSVRTSANKRLLVGHAEDADLGKITSIAYFQINTDSIRQAIPRKGHVEYKSLTLDCDYDNYSYYDTLADFDLSVYPVMEDIKLRKDGYMYNVDHYNYDSLSPGTDSRIAEIHFKPRPYGQNLEIPINDEFGIFLYNYLRDNSKNSYLNFQKIFKGFALVPGNENNCFIGFGTKTRFLLVYTIEGIDNTIVFSLQGNVILFNHITSDRNETNLRDLTQQKYSVESLATNHVSYIQGGVGLGIKIRFPTLSAIHYINRNIVISEAKLDLYPLKNSYNVKTLLTGNLQTFSVDRYNRVINKIDAPETMSVDYEFNENTFYEFDITSFIQRQIHNPTSIEDGLLVVFNDTYFNSSVNRLIILDHMKEIQTKLKLKLISIGD